MRASFLASVAFGTLATMAAGAGHAQILEIPGDSGSRGRVERAPTEEHGAPRARDRRLSQDEERPSARRGEDQDIGRGERPERAQRGERQERAQRGEQEKAQRAEQEKGQRAEQEKAQRAEQEKAQRAEQEKAQRSAQERNQQNRERNAQERGQGAGSQNDPNARNVQQQQNGPSGRQPSTAQSDQDQTRAGQDPARQRRQSAQPGQPNAASPAGRQDNATQQAQPGESGSSQPQQNAQTPQTEPDAPSRQSAASTHVDIKGELNIRPDHASRIHDTLLRSGERTNVRVDVTVGRTLPTSVRLRPLPADVIALSPDLRGYDYTVVEDEVVIIEPKSRRVVEVLDARGGAGAGVAAGAPARTGGAASAPAPESTGSVGGPAAQLALSVADRQRIRQALLNDGDAARLDINTGVRLPDRIEVANLPDEVTRAVPAVKGYQYFLSNDRVVIVDPQSRGIVDVIQ